MLLPKHRIIVYRLEVYACSIGVFGLEYTTSIYEKLNQQATRVVRKSTKKPEVVEVL
jgi:hypothetical protein